MWVKEKRPTVVWGQHRPRTAKSVEFKKSQNGSEREWWVGGGGAVLFLSLQLSCFYGLRQSLVSFSLCLSFHLQAHT